MTWVTFLWPMVTGACITTALIHLRLGRRSTPGTAQLLFSLSAFPRGAVLCHALGLALVRQKQSADRLIELRKAVKLAPENARFAYVYAVALHDAGQIKAAIQVLATALKREPYDRDVLSSLAYFTAQAGNRQQAPGYVCQLRELDPESSQYSQLAKQIQSAP